MTQRMLLLGRSLHSPTCYEIYTARKSATPNILDGVESRDLRNALKAEDVKRRRNEAETFIKEHPDTSNAVQK